MPILENNSDYVENDQLLPANLNALTESAQFVKSGSGVASTGNTTDETSCDINANGEIEVKDGGVLTAKIADNAVTNAKIVASAVQGSAGAGNVSIASATIDTLDLAADLITEAKIEDEAVQAEHLQSTIIAGLTETTDEPADTDELAISDAGALKRIDVSDLAKCRFFPQAYGQVEFAVADGAVTVTDGLNVTSATKSGDQITVTLAITMSTATYPVICTYKDTSASTSNALFIAAQTATTFTIDNSGSSGGATKFFNFAVFGNRA